MGILRFLLAVSVLALHCNSILGHHLVGGLIAVQSFYIISGFYMAMVLTTKYAKTSRPYTLFITNRALKLYPTYYAVCLGTIAMVIASCYLAPDNEWLRSLTATWHRYSLPSKTAGVLANLSLLGQDLLFLVREQGGRWVYTGNYPATGSLNELMLLPQAWTVGLEICFYMVAPFLVRLPKTTLVAIGVFLLITRLYFYGLGYTGRPWNYQFFPFELLFFISGMLTYKYYDLLLKVPRVLKYILTGTLLYLLFVHFQLYTETWSARIVFYVVVIILIPSLFEFTRNFKADRAIGELSYPIYMVHLLGAFAVNYLVRSDNYFFGVAVLAVSIVLSWMINKLIQDPIERYRQKRVKATDKIQPL